jgi:hypothetical protein
MPYSKQDLSALYTLSLDEVNQTLAASELSTEAEQYTDEQIQTRFDIVRAYFSNGQVSDYVAAAQLFKQNLGDVQLTKDENAAKGQELDLQHSNTETSSQPLNLYQLLASASSSCGTAIKLNEAIEIFAHCGVAADLEQYTTQECDRFIYACNLIKKENKTLEEVAAHFGVGSASKTNAVHSPQQLLELLGDSTVVVDDNLMDLINKITAKQTDGVNLNKLVRQSYFMNLSRRISENQDDTDTFFADLESRVMDYVEGKNRARSLGTTWEWATNSLPPSSPKPMSLPEDSSNGTNGD